MIAYSAAYLRYTAAYLSNATGAVANSAGLVVGAAGNAASNTIAYMTGDKTDEINTLTGNIPLVEKHQAPLVLSSYMGISVLFVILMGRLWETNNMYIEITVSLMCVIILNFLTFALDHGALKVALLTASQNVSTGTSISSINNIFSGGCIAAALAVPNPYFLAAGVASCIFGGFASGMYQNNEKAVTVRLWKNMAPYIPTHPGMLLVSAVLGAYSMHMAMQTMKMARAFPQKTQEAPNQKNDSDSETQTPTPPPTQTPPPTTSEEL
jgi:hypothetical protein